MNSATSMTPTIIIDSQPTIRKGRALVLALFVVGSVLSIVLTIATHLPSLTYAASASSLSIASGMQHTTQTQKVSVITKTTPQKVTEQANIAKRLVRIYAYDRTEYNNQDEYNIWASSACSAITMTEVINAFWGYQRYRTTDILTQERLAQAITPDAGLLQDGDIEKTMRRFGFVVNWGYKWSLQQIIDIGNAGQPVIVSFPPPWGHILVVHGGDANNVFLADSSKLNLTTYPRVEFLKHWRGYVALATPSPYSIVGKPTLTPARINTILSAYHSPLSGRGQDIYTTTIKYGIDPALAMGFYLHESSMGTQGEAATTNSWGNLRCVSDAACINTQRQPCQPGQSCYAAFPNGIAGLNRWCVLLMSNLYVGDGRVIVDDIIDRYAPSGDNNNVGGYIWNLKKSTDTWRAGGVTV